MIVWDILLGLAAQYIQYLGTKKLTAAELAVAFYSLGISTNISATRDRIYISMDGLDESFSAGVSVFEHYLKNLQPDEDALKNMIDGILKSREDAKLSKGNILRRGMLNYAKYGTESPLRNIMSEEELHAVTTEKLMENIKRMMQYKHRIFYYGKTDPLEVLKVLNEHHKISKKGVLAYPLPVTYTQLEMKQDQVYFVNYDMVQAEFMMVAKDKLYDPTLAAQTQLFNAYFGSGLSSIVFQEIRESKGLAYSSWSRYSTPRTVDESHYITSYIGTQADKLPDAVNAIKELMDNMPVAPMQYDAAKESVMKKIASQRTTKSAIFWSYENAKRHNMDYDIRQDIYEAMRTTEITDLIKFHESHIQGRNYTFLVIGSRDKVDMDFLKSLGEFKELTLEDVFNY
ncbi:MAG: insulinase family protein [Bacteroidetes bacterium]|nr:insulinase family protein [Bacteroidota bacterium]